jgi:hypothetical protein
MHDLSVLKQALASWSLLEISAAAVVFAGVVLVLLTQFELLGRWLALERFPLWHSAVGKLGALLVILGLAGEIIAATKARVISDRIAVQLTERTAAAIERSKAMEKDAAELRLQLARLKWRVITPEQQATLTEFLKNTPKGPVLVLHALDDEPRSYAMQISDALKAAGFDPKMEQSAVAQNLPGTWLLVQNLQQTPPHAVPLQMAFREIHVDMDGQQDPQRVPDPGMVVMLVGARRL